MIVLLAGALMALSASSAFAYFGNGELNFYAYNNTTGSSEVGVDLGSIGTLLTKGADTTITAGASNVAALKTGASSVYGGLYGFDAASGNIWIVADAGKTLAANYAQYANFVTANGQINATYASAAGRVNTLASKGTSSTNDYFGRLDKGTTGQGTYASMIATAQGGDFKTTLAANVVKDIYFLDAKNGVTNFIDTGATAIFKTDGSIEVKAASAVPIPPAFFLMGSGLLGMIGLRRKNA